MLHLILQIINIHHRLQLCRLTTSTFNCPLNMALISAGTIFSIEVVRHHKIIHWLGGLTKCCQYASQSSLVVCLIAITFSSATYFHYFSCFFASRRNPRMDFATRLAPCKFSLIFSMIMFFVGIVFVISFSSSLG